MQSTSEIYSYIPKVGFQMKHGMPIMDFIWRSKAKWKSGEMLE